MASKLEMNLNKHIPLSHQHFNWEGIAVIPSIKVYLGHEQFSANVKNISTTSLIMWGKGQMRSLWRIMKSGQHELSCSFPTREGCCKATTQSDCACLWHSRPLVQGFSQSFVPGPVAAVAVLGSSWKMQIRGPTSDLLRHSASGLQSKNLHHCEAGSLSPGTNNIWAKLFLFVGFCPVPRGVSSSIPHLNLLDASNVPPPHVTAVTKNVSRPWQMFPGGTIAPWVKNQCGSGFSCMLKFLLHC